MTGQDPTAEEIDTSRPQPVRIHDWYLGRKDNHPFDEEMGRHMPALDPGAGDGPGQPSLHAPRHAPAGPAGSPPVPGRRHRHPDRAELHQIAQRTAPDARVVYCDNDPMVPDHAAALLRSTPEGTTDYLQADVRDPDTILAGAKPIPGLDHPGALSLVAPPHHISDEDGAHDLVGRLLAEPPFGSYLVMTHATADFIPEESAAATEKLRAAGVILALRSREQFTRFFDGLELTEPGVEIVHKCPPELGEPVLGQDDGIIPGDGAVARKR